MSTCQKLRNWKSKRDNFCIFFPIFFFSLGISQFLLLMHSVDRIKVERQENGQQWYPNAFEKWILNIVCSMCQQNRSWAKKDIRHFTSSNIQNIPAPFTYSHSTPMSTERKRRKRREQKKWIFLPFFVFVRSFDIHDVVLRGWHELWRTSEGEIKRFFSVFWEWNRVKEDKAKFER